MAQTRRCVVCGGASRRGLDIGGGHICAECEARIVASRPGSREYEGIMRSMKALDMPMQPLTDVQAEALEAELYQPDVISVDELLASVGLEPMDAHRGKRMRQRAMRRTRMSLERGGGQ